MNKIAKIGIVGVLMLGAYKLFGMKTLSEKLMIQLSNPRIHKIDMKGIYFRTEILLQNPTKYIMTITKPFITITTNGKYVSGNSPEQKTYKIKALDTTEIDTVEIPISWSVLAGYASGIILKIPALVKAYQSSDLKAIGKQLAIPLEMKYSVYANDMYYECEPQKLL